MANAGRWRWDKIRKKFVSYDEPPRETKSPYIMTDEIKPMPHPVDGQIFTSRKKMRRHTYDIGAVKGGA